MFKSNVTRKKFYGKWLYKASLRLPGIAVLRNHSLQDVVDFLNKTHSEENLKLHYYRKAYANRDDITDLCSYLSTLDTADWSKRIEVNNLDLYTNEQSIYNTLCEKFKHILLLCSEPDPSRSADYENQNYIVCKKLPHDLYRYKIYLKPHKMKNDRLEKQHYIDWLETQKNVLISEAVKDWFVRTDWNWDRRYILVEDQRTLLFLHMRSPEVLGKVYEYVLSDK
jgi:hypothetical protein